MAYHHGDLREALIAASLAIVETDGADNLSLRRAAREAGVSSGAPYKHFSNKDELLSAVAARALEQQMEHSRAAMAAAGPSPLARFRAQGVSAVVWSANHPELFRLIHRPGMRDRNRSPEMDAILGRSVAMFGEQLGEALSAGELGDSTAGVVALTTQALTYGLCRMFVDGQMAEAGIGPERAEELTMAATGLLGSGLLPRS